MAFEENREPASKTSLPKAIDPRLGTPSEFQEVSEATQFRMTLFCLCIARLTANIASFVCLLVAPYYTIARVETLLANNGYLIIQVAIILVANFAGFCSFDALATVFARAIAETEKRSTRSRNRLL